MTPEEALKQTRNHSTEVREILQHLDTALGGMARGFIPIDDTVKDMLKDTLTVAKTRIDELKAIVGGIE